MPRVLKHDMKVRQDGDTWCIWGIGVSKEGKTWCHLGSTTRFIKQRNGDKPVQVQTWVAGLPDKPNYINVGDN